MQVHNSSLLDFEGPSYPFALGRLTRPLGTFVRPLLEWEGPAHPSAIVACERTPLDTHSCSPLATVECEEKVLP